MLFSFLDLLKYLYETNLFSFLFSSRKEKNTVHVVAVTIFNERSDRIIMKSFSLLGSYLK